MISPENKITQNAHLPASEHLKAQARNDKPNSYLADNRPSSIAQKKQVEALSAKSPVQRQANNTGLPDLLKSGIENLSGHSMDDVKVHYNSDKPAQLNAHAYAQGTDIHIASGQEKHLPHEAWHVVQQKQGRVQPTMQMKGKVNINNDKGLENEADVMGYRALSANSTAPASLKSTPGRRNAPVQGVFEYEGIKYSEKAKYGITNGASDQLYVEKTAQPPVPEKHFAKTGAIEKEILPGEKKSESETEKTPAIKFNIYSSNKELNGPKSAVKPNDCGMYANALALDKDSWANEKELGEHLKGMIKPQNDSDQYDANDTKSKDKLSLDIGDMYRIDWDDSNKELFGKSAFHVAAVVAKDGADHVTSEADAGETLKKPKFSLYGTEKDTFWQTHQAYFSAENQGKPFVSKYKNPKNQK